MGNCQATNDVVGVLLEHTDGKIERFYWSLSARQLMLQYPGNYVALVPTVPAGGQDGHKAPLRVASSKLKLMPPDASLLVGQHYRLVSFEDVLQEMTDSKAIRSPTLAPSRSSKRVYSEQPGDFPVLEKNDRLLQGDEDSGGPTLRAGTGGPMRSISFAKAGWRPALQSISELARLQTTS